MTHEKPNKIIECSIEKEKKRHKNTTCFICAKKGHFAIDCREVYDIDGNYIEDENKCKKIKNIKKLKSYPKYLKTNFIL